MHWHCIHFGDKIPFHPLTLHTFFFFGSTPSCADIAHIFGMRYSVRWHCTHFFFGGGWGTPLFPDIAHIFGMKYPFIRWHCMQCWDKIPLCALTLHSFLGWDTPSCTDVEHNFGTRCRGLGWPHIWPLPGQGLLLDLLVLLQCSRAEHSRGHPGNAIVHWQLHPQGWEDCRCDLFYSLLLFKISPATCVNHMPSLEDSWPFLDSGCHYARKDLIFSLHPVNRDDYIRVMEQQGACHGWRRSPHNYAAAQRRFNVATVFSLVSAC